MTATENELRELEEKLYDEYINCIINDVIENMKSIDETIGDETFTSRDANMFQIGFLTAVTEFKQETALADKISNMIKTILGEVQ